MKADEAISQWAQQGENAVPVPWDRMPEIDLYMDQVLTYMHRQLSLFERSEDNPLLTSSMINNYVKQKIIEAPVKKKYNRNNIAYLFVICILKQVYSISDIYKLITLALETAPIDKSYNSFCDALENAIDSTFNGKKILDDIPTSTNKYILFNVVQTFASKLYVEKNFLGN